MHVTLEQICTVDIVFQGTIFVFHHLIPFSTSSNDTSIHPVAGL